MMLQVRMGGEGYDFSVGWVVEAAVGSPAGAPEFETVNFTGFAALSELAPGVFTGFIKL